MEIKVLHQVMEWNQDVSEQVRKTLAEHKVCMINVMGSPGTGKTSASARRLRSWNVRPSCSPGVCRS